MREIKFRAWDKESYKMRYISLSEMVRAMGVEWGLNENQYGFMYVTDNKEFMEYTGLKDRNGLEIYEGDIVEAEHRRTGLKRLLVVTFLNGCFVFDSCNAHEVFSLFGALNVIGNIYENEDLLNA